MSERPTAGQLIWLRAASGAGYDAEVLAVHGTTVVLGRPTDHPEFTEAQVLEALWSDGDALFSQQLQVDEDGPQWLAVPVADAGPAQRRAHARIAVNQPMMLVWGHIAADGMLLDMSEAALRVLLPEGTAGGLEPETAVHADVSLDDETFVLPGHVLRAEAVPEGTEAVVLFDDVAGATVNRIRRALFFEQLRLDVLN